MLARFIVDCQLDFVRLVHFDGMIFGFPAVITGCASSGNDGIFNLDRYKSFGATGEASSSGMVNVLECHDSDGELTAQRLAEVWHVDRIV